MEEEEKTAVIISFNNYKLYRMIKASFTEAGHLVKFGFHDATYTAIAKDFIDQKISMGIFLQRLTSYITNIPIEQLSISEKESFND